MLVNFHQRAKMLVNFSDEIKLLNTILSDWTIFSTQIKWKSKGIELKPLNFRLRRAKGAPQQCNPDL